MRSKSRSPTKLTDLMAIPRSQTLDLSHQNFSRIPSCKNQDIKKLCLNNNKLSDLVGIETYPNLKQLDLSNNQLKSWKELKRVGKSLQVLTIENNPLLNEPNYLYNIVLLFPLIKKVNRMIMNEELRKNTIQQQTVISSKLLNWMVELNRMDQRLTKTFHSEYLKVENMNDYHEAIDVLEIEKQSLLSQLEPLTKFKNESIFVKTRMIHDLLSRQPEICFETSQREAVEENYFQYLISLITKINRNIAEFLASQITISDHKAEKELLGNESLMFKKMYYHFKKHWIEQFISPNTDANKITDMYENVFPYYPFEEVFVECMYQSLINILQSNLKKIEESLENVSKSQPPSLQSSLPSSFHASDNHEKRLNETKFIGDGLHPSTWLSENSLKPIRLSELAEKVSQIQDDYGDYLPFCETICEVLSKKKKKQFFNRIHKSITTIKKMETMGWVVRGLNHILSKYLKSGFNKIREDNLSLEIIQNHHRNRYLKLSSFQVFKQLVYIKYLKLDKLQNLISKKQRATKLIKAYSFKRWKLMASRTLKYIREVKRSLGKKDSLEENYKRIVTERLGPKRRASMLVRGTYN